MQLKLSTGWRILAIGALSCVLAACSSDAPEGGAKTEVRGSVGEGTGVQQFDLRKQGLAVVVRVYDRGEGARIFAVSTRSYRGLDRGDSRLAFEAAAEAAQRLDCNGQPAALDGGSALFQEAGRRSAYTSGEAAWIFQGRCA